MLRNDVKHITACHIPMLRKDRENEQVPHTLSKKNKVDD